MLLYDKINRGPNQPSKPPSRGCEAASLTYGDINNNTRPGYTWLLSPSNVTQCDFSFRCWCTVTNEAEVG